VTFYFNLESLVLPDSQVHPFYTPSSRAIFGDVRRCSAMFGEVRRGSARFGDVIRCSAMLSELQFTIVTDSGGEFKLDMKYIQAAIPNWSGDLDTRRSTIGDVFSMAERLLGRADASQLLPLCTTEAKYVASAD